MSLGDQLQYYVVTSVQQADSDSWFYFRPHAHLQKMDLGLLFFREQVLHVSYVKCPENLYANTSCYSSADACVLINQVTLVSSSWLPSDCTAYSCSCYCLLWYAKICTYKSTTNTLSLFSASVNTKAVKIECQAGANSGKMCALHLVWNSVSDVMVFIEQRRVKGTVNMTRHTSECGKASQLI